ncbi:ATP-dependent protease ATPase subunit HslU [Rubinisphaera margarita]|uniref:ATP-dependent protease ATPase subunit HslU n=1 Tax=Rubinisphaera margarita TaxID=2909586 RepID=UPI001EE7B137|nr:ATP-dependent protease ATPase subunit HslU [Rubinisphaera margarita]MCG6154486.1 ATP-dependent protease ATPase subunit HslU [Rubinisphaera margarita]
MTTPTPTTPTPRTYLEMTPQEIVDALNRHIVGQNDAKRAVAIALRNRYRWRKLSDEQRKEITPKNIIMIGPTGVGKTEITRRLANMTGAPFIKVEATKYTEVGYYGRDVESMIRDLVEASILLVRQKKKEELREKAEQGVENRLLDLLLPAQPTSWNPEVKADDMDDKHTRTREKFRQMLRDGSLEDREVEVHVEQKNAPVQVFSNMGMDQMDMDLQGMFDKLVPKKQQKRKMPVKDARKILIEQETEALMDKDAIAAEAIRLAEDTGIVFIDEIDKVCGSAESKNADVSRQGVQRDLLPIVEGTTVQTKHGSVKTEYMLFIAAGAFHRARPADLMPELQGRFPIRVELQDLTRDDLLRILTEPTNSLTTQYQQLLAIDGVNLTFTQDGIEQLADIAYHVNQSTQNIGARRLHTMLERLLEEISFRAPSDDLNEVVVDAEFVKRELGQIAQDEDLSKFIL